MRTIELSFATILHASSSFYPP